MDPRSNLGGRREQTDPQRIVALLQRLQLGDVRSVPEADAVRLVELVRLGG